MSDVLENGTMDEIINFIETKNILNSNIFNFSDIYYLLKNKQFFTKLIEVLRKKLVFDQTVWSYGFYHGDEETVKEIFSSESS